MTKDDIVTQLNNPDAFHYEFGGIVYPARWPVSFDPMHALVYDAISNIRVSLAYQAVNSIVTVQCSSESLISDLPTLRNLVRNMVQSQVNAIGFAHGCHLHFDIEQVTDKRTGHTTTFLPVLEILQNRQTQGVATIRDVWAVYSMPEVSGYLRECLSDLQKSLQYPQDTAFFCYRAIETLRQYFDKKMGKKDWLAFRETLKVEHSSIEFIANLAKPVRHGEPSYITSEQRNKAYLITWEIVDKFIVFAKAES